MNILHGWTFLSSWINYRFSKEDGRNSDGFVFKQELDFIFLLCLQPG